MSNNVKEDLLIVRLPYKEVHIVAGGRKKFGSIMIWEKEKSGEWYIDLHGKATWFSSSDPEMSMKIRPSDIDHIDSHTESITINLKNSKFNNVEVFFKNYEDKVECYEVAIDMIVNHKEGKKGRSSTELLSMDYSKIDNNIKEELAERVAMIFFAIERLCFVAEPQFVVDELLDIRKELIQLVNDLGGHPAVSYNQVEVAS